MKTATETMEYRKGSFEQGRCPAAVLPGGSWREASSMVTVTDYLPVPHRLLSLSALQHCTNSFAMCEPRIMGRRLCYLYTQCKPSGSVPADKRPSIRANFLVYTEGSKFSSYVSGCAVDASTNLRAPFRTQKRRHANLGSLIEHRVLHFGANES